MRVAKRLGAELDVDVRTTLLAAHAVPPEFAGRPDAWIDAVCEDIVPAAARARLADAVDVFCDTIGFTREQTRRVFDAARANGLPVKLHAEQLSDQDGAALAAEYDALSADHLEWLVAARRRRDGAGGHGRGAAAGGVLRPARNADAADRRAARAAACRWPWRRTPTPARRRRRRRS